MCRQYPSRRRDGHSGPSKASWDRTPISVCRPRPEARRRNPSPRPRRRRAHQAQRRGAAANQPVHEIVHEGRSFRRQSSTGEALENPFADQGGRGSFIPAFQVGRKLPVQKFLLPAAPPVPRVPDQVHRNRPHRPGNEAAQNRAEWSDLDVVTGHSVCP
jgi:hypothetical protein